MKVLKFGGSSVADATNMIRVMDIARRAMATERIILVSSAISGCTDSLIAIGNTEQMDRERLIAPLRSRHLEIIRSLLFDKARDAAMQECEELFEEIEQAPGDLCPVYGELLSTRILVRKFLAEGIDAEWLDSRMLVVKGDEEESAMRIKKAMGRSTSRVFIAPGFIASDKEGRPTTLGRGGSDYSSALYAVGSEADTLEIWTDVPGIMTANPKDIEAARTISEISYEGAWTMAECGAAVLYPPTVKPAERASVPVYIKNTFSPSHPGTKIGDIPAQGRALGVTRLGDYVYAVFDNEEAVAKNSEALKKAIEDAGIDILEAKTQGLAFGVRTKSRGETLRLMHKTLFEI